MTIDVDFVSDPTISLVPVHLAKMKIGRQDMRLWISLQEQTMSVVHKDCQECRSDVKYNAETGLPAHDERYRVLKCSNIGMNYMDGIRPNNTQVASVSMSGTVYEDLLTFQFKDTGAIKFKDLRFCAVD